MISITFTLSATLFVVSIVNIVSIVSTNSIVAKSKSDVNTDKIVPVDLCWTSGDCLDFYDSLTRLRIMKILAFLTESNYRSGRSLLIIERRLRLPTYVVDCNRWYPIPTIHGCDDDNATIGTHLYESFKISSSFAISNAVSRIRNLLNALFTITVERCNRILLSESFPSKLSLDYYKLYWPCDHNDWNKCSVQSERRRGILRNKPLVVNSKIPNSVNGINNTCNYSIGDCIDVLQAKTTAFIRDIRDMDVSAIPALTFVVKQVAEKFNVTVDNFQTLGDAIPESARESADSLKINDYDEFECAYNSSTTHPIYEYKILSSEFSAKYFGQFIVGDVEKIRYIYDVIDKVARSLKKIRSI